MSYLMDEKRLLLEFEQMILFSIDFDYRMQVIW
jgi:hypothetical protein